jgi:DNA polymerase-3 subunit delta'
MTLGAIIGHTAVITLLEQAVARRRVPQSLLLAGPEGVGKHAIAVALAQAINCPAQRDGDGCGTCSVCSRIARGQFSDVVVVDTGGEASIKIRHVRERVLERIGYRPFEGTRRVVIIDPADALTLEAQDALLKTLEEPPPSATIVLVTAYPDTLLPTIQSRCRRLRVGPLSEVDVARVLVERAGIATTVARTLAAASGGSVTRALAVQGGEFEADREAALGLLAAARGGSVVDRLRAATTLAQHKTKRRDRDALAARLAIAASLVRDLAALDIQPGVPLANADIEESLAELAPGFTTERLTEAFAAIDRAETALGRNAGPKIVADWLAVSL